MSLSHRTVLAVGWSAAAALVGGGVALIGPAEADHGHHSSSGRGGSVSVVLTTDATSAIDDAGARLDAINGAWTRRDADGRIVVALDRRHQHQGGTPTATPTPSKAAKPHSHSSGSMAGGFRLVDGSASTTWTAFVVDRFAGTVTASVDGTTETVLTIVAADSGQRATLELTADGASALDSVLGATTFAAGDDLGTLGPCHL